MSEHIRFVVVQSAPGVSPLEQNLFDKGNQLRRAGLSEADLERAQAYRRAYWTYLIGGDGFEAAQVLHAAIVGEPWFTRDSFPFPFQRREELLRDPSLASWALHSAYEPRLTLESIRVPLLAVFGSEDSVVPVERSVSAFSNAFAVSGNEGLSMNVVNGADHGIRVASEDGWRSMSTEYMELIVQWVAEQASE